MTTLTIHDIAKLAGVSKSTVSRVLNGEPQVKPQTRQRVEAVIAEHQFKPSASARAMRGVRRRTVGIIVTRLTSGAENQALSQILPRLYQHQCEPIIVESRFNPDAVAEHLRFFRQRHVDGVILFGFTQLDGRRLRSWASKLVAIAKDYADICAVHYDDYGAVQQLMRHLYGQGHRRIGYVGVSDDDATTGFRRHLAYADFCAAQGLSPLAVQGELGYDWAYRQASAVVFDDVSAVLCATDNLAIGVMKYLAEQGRTDVQIAAVGQNPLLQFLFPSVICVDLGFGEAGKVAVEQLFALWDNAPAPDNPPPRPICLNSRLILPETADCSGNALSPKFPMRQSVQSVGK